MQSKTTRLATTAIAMSDFLGMPHPYSETVDVERAVAVSERRVERLGDAFVRAWRNGADIVAGYESITGAGQYGTNPKTRHLLERLAEPVPGPTTDFFGRLARERGGWCAICLEESDGGRIYNAAVLIDRDGQVAGKYRKVHLPPQERIYAAPGDGFPVFETDFGRVGFSICYDLMFPEAARCAAMGGADLLIHMGNIMYTMREEGIRVRAAENMMWVLTSDHEEGISTIVDPTGAVVARANEYTGGLAWVDADLARERAMPPDNGLAGVRSLRGRQCQERVPSAYRVLCDPAPPLLRRYESDPNPKTPEEFERARLEAEPSMRAQAERIEERNRDAGIGPR